MFPHERSLVKKMEGRPFVLIGVNSDRDPEKLKKDNAKEHITWRSFKDQSGPHDQISVAWGIRGWPTIYLIDHKGIVRKTWLGGPSEKELDDALDALVRAAEKG